MRNHSALARTLLRAVIAGSLLGFFSPAMAAVYPPQQVLPAQTVQQFLANPKALLSQYPNGGPDMVKAVQDLAASDPSTLNALVGLLSNANPDQAKAIGTALGNVAKLAVNTDQNYAAQIQVAVVVANDDTALAAFDAVIGGDIQLTAVTGGVGGGGGGGGGPTTTPNFFGGTSTSNPLNLTTATDTTPDAFSTLSFSPGTPGTTTTTTITFNQSQNTP
jgi:hypothetical protein